MPLPDSRRSLKNISKRLRFASSTNVAFGDVVYEPNGSCGPRVQVDYQLVVIEEGEACVQLEGGEVLLREGEVGLFRPGFQELFLFSKTTRTHHTWCSLKPKLVSGELETRSKRVLRVQRVSQRFVQILEVGLGLSAVACREAPELAEMLGLALLQEFLFLADGSGEGRQPEALGRLLDWLGLHAQEPADLPKLARVAGISTAQLVRLCKQHLGVTPVRALWEARTRQGVRMLRETGLSVSEVAFRCGFQTPFHFSRWVKELEGLSPKEVRAVAWGAAKQE